jgi:hypothetical protein
VASFGRPPFLFSADSTISAEQASFCIAARLAQAMGSNVPGLKISEM